MRILRTVCRRWEMAQVIFYRYVGFNYQCGCGHTAKWKTVLTIHGHRGVFTAPSKTPDYCPECWAQAAIRCAWCGGTILPGDAVTLYTPKEGFTIPDYAVAYQREPHLQLVGLPSLGLPLTPEQIGRDSGSCLGRSSESCHLLRCSWRAAARNPSSSAIALIRGRQSRFPTRLLMADAWFMTRQNPDWLYANRGLFFST